MSEVTFQKIYKITIGQFTSDGGIIPLFETTELRFRTSIQQTAKSSTAKTPTVTAIHLYNLGPDNISKLSKAVNMYVEVRAGYLYDGDQVFTTDDLPIVYLGSVIFSNTTRTSTDLMTTFACTAFNDRAAQAKANRQFTAGAKVKEVFNYLAKTVQMPIRHDWIKQEDLVILKDRIVEGATMSIVNDWCERYDLRMVTDKGVIKIIDKAVRHVSSLRHTIPLSRIKGYPSLAVDLSKVLKEKTTPVPDVTLETFLYPLISLNDSMLVELIDFSSPQIVGEYAIETQEFIVTSYTHKLDSHAVGSWETTITGKGSQ